MRLAAALCILVLTSACAQASEGFQTGAAFAVPTPAPPTPSPVPPDRVISVGEEVRGLTQLPTSRSYGRVSD
jgi:hypothetical protein